MEDKNTKEIQILMALFNATVQQSTMLTGVHKQQAKQIFNRWQKQGFKLFDVVQKNIDGNNLSEDFERATEIIEDAVDVLRKEIE